MKLKLSSKNSEIHTVLVLFCLALFIVFVSIPSASAEAWWNTSWHFRVPVNVSSSSPFYNASTELNINFSQLLSSLGIDGEFNSSSVRVMEISNEKPHDWENETSSKGNVTWIANGTTPGSTNRTFWIYFDVVENGAKSYGQIISELVNWRSGYTNNLDVYSSTWNRSWAQSVEVSWKWSSEPFYDYAYLYINDVLMSTKDNVGSENISFLGSSIKGRFTSDTSGIYSATDEYGTYGCAIDLIKFYPVTNYTTPSLNAYMGNAEMQDLKNNFESPSQDAVFEQGDIITFQTNITDAGSNLVSGATVLFIISNGSTEYSCSTTENTTGKYTCLWNSSDKSVGNYSVRINSSKEFYNSNSTLWADRFSIESGPPIISITLAGVIEQNSSVQINASVQDQSGTGIEWVKVNVTQPNNYTDENNMSNASGVWTINYTNVSQRGVYLVKVFSKDNNNKTGQSNSTFQSYIHSNVTLRTQSSSYYQDSYGRVEYLITDFENNTLQNANVSLSIKNPSGVIIWDNENQTKLTSQNGIIEPQPSFHIVSSDPAGNYTLFSFTTYLDSMANYTTNRTDNYTFQVYGQATNELTLDLESPLEVSTGDYLRVSAVVTDGAQNVDADSIRATLYDPVSNLIIDNVSMTQIETGLYSLSYLTSSSSTQGNWRWVIRAIRGSNTITKQIFSHFVGGPFDVRNITVSDNTVPDLSVSVIVENKGSGGQDVTVEWNLTRTDTDARLDSGADTVYVAGNSFQSYTSAPSTDYIGEVKITFLAYYSGTEKAGAYSTFSTVAGGEIPPGGGGGAGGGGGGGAAAKELTIVNSTAEIDVERGAIGLLNLILKNTGYPLANVSVSISGIDPDWVTLPDIFSLGIDETKSVNVLFNAPLRAESLAYNGTVIVSSQGLRDEAPFVLKIFATKLELFLYRIQNLKNRIKDTENRTIYAQLKGKDVTVVRGLLDSARKRLTEAEMSLNSQKYEETQNSITMAGDYLDRADFELQIAKVFQKPFTQSWLFYLLIILGLIMILIVVLVVIKLRKMELSISSANLRKVFIDRVPSGKLKKQKEKIEKILSLLEREYKQKMISRESYEEIREKNVEKLSEIDDLLQANS